MLPLGLSQSKQPKQWWQQQTTQARKSPDFATSTPTELLSWQLNPFPVTVADCLIRVASGHVKIMCDVSVCPCAQMTIVRPCSTLFSIRTNRTWIFWSVEFRCDRPDLRPSTRTALSTTLSCIIVIFNVELCLADFPITWHRWKCPLRYGMLQMENTDRILQCDNKPFIRRSTREVGKLEVLSGIQQLFLQSCVSSYRMINPRRESTTRIFLFIGISFMRG